MFEVMRNKSSEWRQILDMFLLTKKGGEKGEKRRSEEQKRFGSKE